MPKPTDYHCVNANVLRPIGPKPAENVRQDVTCPACGKGFAAGDYTTLIAIGPGDDPEERERCRKGEQYNAVAVEAHWACVTGRED